MRKHLLWLLLLSGCSCEEVSLNDLFPLLLPSQNRIDFGDTYVGGTYTQTLVVENAGSATLTLSALNFDDERFSSDINNATLVAGETRSIVLTFVPNALGEVFATLTLQSDAQNGESRAIEVRARILESPNCDDDNSCTDDNLNFQTGACLNVNLNDMSTCLCQTQVSDVHS